MVRWGQALAVAAAVTLLGGCGSGSPSPTAAGSSPGVSSPSPSHETHPTHPTPPTRHTRSPTPSVHPTRAASGPTKVLVFVVENHSLDEMRAQMPWTAALADRYGYATAYHALTHPSLPNYLAIAGGSTFGVQDDGDPSSHPISGPSVFGQALASGSTGCGLRTCPLGELSRKECRNSAVKKREDRHPGKVAQAHTTV